MKFVNLTPHAINVLDEGGNVILSLPPSGEVARVDSRRTLVGRLGPVPVFKTVFGDVVGLPDPRPDTVFVVSTLVLSALASKGVTRDDIVAPDTSPQGAVRDAEGRIIGVRGFQRL